MTRLFIVTFKGANGFVYFLSSGRWTTDKRRAEIWNTPDDAKRALADAAPDISRLSLRSAEVREF